MGQGLSQGGSGGYESVVWVWLCKGVGEGEGRGDTPSEDVREARWCWCVCETHAIRMADGCGVWRAWCARQIHVVCVVWVGGCLGARVRVWVGAGVRMWVSV